MQSEAPATADGLEELASSCPGGPTSDRKAHVATYNDAPYRLRRDELYVYLLHPGSNRDS